jgi:hypothetical protein
MSEEQPEVGKSVRRQVPADLVETVPESNGLMHWILASPLMIFLAWVWIDLFSHFSPIPAYLIDALLGLIVFAIVVVLPFGVAAFYLVTAVPRLFGHAGWDVQPLESVSEAELYTVRYTYQARRRAPTTWGQTLARAGQGWVYIEIATILIGAVVMVPIFFSVSDFGFGQP